MRKITTRITCENVRQAAAALTARGVVPSVRKVRAELGECGSHSTITKHLRELKEDQNATFFLNIMPDESNLAARVNALETSTPRSVDLEATVLDELQQLHAAVARLHAEIAQLRAASGAREVPADEQIEGSSVTPGTEGAPDEATATTSATPDTEGALEAQHAPKPRSRKKSRARARKDQEPDLFD